ncbi:MAG: LexA family protein [Ramlibacter sp.]
MNSSFAHPPGSWPFVQGGALQLPMAPGAVRAGFPSPADDFSVKRHDLNELLITHPTATFFWRVRGTSMQGAGIADGDILVVNRALVARHGDVVVAEVDNDFTVKYLFQRNGRVKLQAADPTFPDIVFEREGQRLAVVGVVTCTIKRFR